MRLLGLLAIIVIGLLVTVAEPLAPSVDPRRRPPWWARHSPRSSPAIAARARRGRGARDPWGAGRSVVARNCPRTSWHGAARTRDADLPAVARREEACGVRRLRGSGGG